jgi:hypothetical protein
VDYPRTEFVWDIADDQGTQDSVKCSFSKITAHDGADSDDLGDAILGMEIDGSHSNLGGALTIYMGLHHLILDRMK